MAADLREVELALRVTTSNTEAVRDLQGDLKALGKEGDAAAPELENLSGELSKLLDESKQLDNLTQAASAIGALADKQQVAAAKAAELAAQFNALTESTKTAAQAQQEAKAQWQAAKDAVQAQNDAIRVLRASVKDGTLTEYQYGQQLKQSLEALAESKARVRELRDVHEAAKAATSSARAEQNALSNDYRNANSAADALARKLSDLGESTTASARAMGLSAASADEMAGAQARIGQSLAEAKQRMLAYADELDRARRAAVEQQQVSEAAATAEKANAVGYATWWKNALQAREQASAKLEQAIRTEAQAARQSAASVQEAFGTIGVKSVSDLEARIDATVRAMRTLRDSGELTGAELSVAMKQGNASIADLERQIRSARGEMTVMDRVSGLWTQSLGGMRAGTALAIAAVAALTQAVANTGRAFLEAVVQGDQLRRGLTAVYKDAETTASQMVFLRKTASESGASLGSLSGAFVRFSASMQSANIPMSQSNALFSAITRASASLGLSAEETAGTLTALGQMASKGTVSMEELRQQLGDRLPGALGLSAKGLGITEAQLISLVESGNLAARDLFPALTKALNDLGGETDGLLPTWERFKGLLTQTAQAMGEAGTTVLLTGTLKVLGAAVGSVVWVLQGFVETVYLVGAGVTALYGALRGDADAFGFFQQQLEKSGERLASVRDALLGLVDPSRAAAKGATDVGAAHVATAEQVRTAQVAMEKYTGSNLQSAQAAKLLADAHDGAATSIVKFNVNVSEMLTKQALAIQVAQNDLKATKERGDALVTLAKLTGDATKEREAEAQAAAANLQASEALTAAKRTEVELLAVQRRVLIEDAQARGLGTEEVKKAADAIDAKLAKSASELDQLQGSTKALESESVARKLASDAMRDNSQRLGEYEEAVKTANAEVFRLQVLQRAGLDVSKELAAAQSKLAQAEYMRSDALKDQIANLEANTRLGRAVLDLQAAQIAGSVKRYELLASEARSIGDVSTATYYEIRAKEEELRITQLKLKISELEQNAQLAEIEIKRKAIDASTDEGQAKLRLLDIEVQTIKVKQELNAETRTQIEAQQREIDALRNGTSLRGASTNATNADTQARNTNSAAIGTQTTAINQQSTALQRLNEINSRYSAPGQGAQPPKPGDSGSDYDPGYGSPYRNPGEGAPRNGLGETKEQYDRRQSLKGQNAVDNTLSYKIRDKLQSGTLAASDLGDVQNVIAALKQNQQMDSFARQMGGLSTAAIEDSQRWSNLIPLLEEFVRRQKTEASGSSGGASSATSTAKTYNVTIGSKTVRTVSDSDAQTLMELLAQAQRAA